jgi:hypothetical protein
MSLTVCSGTQASYYKPVITSQLLQASYYKPVIKHLAEAVCSAISTLIYIRIGKKKGKKEQMTQGKTTRSSVVN